MIVERVAGEDVLSDLRIDEVVESDNESSVTEHVWNGRSDGPPKTGPRQFGRSHECIESSGSDMGKTEQGVDASEQV